VVTEIGHCCRGEKIGCGTHCFDYGAICGIVKEQRMVHKRKSDYHRTSAGAECGALYFFKFDSGGVSIMSGGYGLIVPTG
jgi:hypothetical protein